MKTYLGSCHCGAVRFEATTVLDRATDCDCSLCRRRAALHHRVAPENFRLLAGADALSLYQFGSRTAQHWFCRHCGIHPFTNPRAAPDLWALNLRCLDGADDEVAAVEIRRFHGRDWEAAMKHHAF